MSKNPRGAEISDAYLIHCQCGQGIAILMKRDVQNKVAKCDWCGNVYTHDTYAGTDNPESMKSSGNFYLNLLRMHRKGVSR